MNDKMYRLKWMNNEQYECLQFLIVLFRGYHHIRGKIHPQGDSGIRINCTNKMFFATYDFSGLTRAVVLAHEKMFRFEIIPSSPNMIGIMVHKRWDRDGKTHLSHPTIEQAIKYTRSDTEGYI